MRAANKPLNARQQKFASLIAIGYEQAEAYRKTHYCKGLTTALIGVRACKLAAKAAVREYADAFLKELKVSDLDCAASCVKDLLADIEKAREASNWTALASLTRLRCQLHGILSDTLNVNAESKLSDDQLISRLADTNPQLSALLRAKLGEGDGYARQ